MSRLPFSIVSGRTAYQQDLSLRSKGITTVHSAHCGFQVKQFCWSVSPTPFKNICDSVTIKDKKGTKNV